MDEGQLRQADPLLAARQFRALLEADIVERCLMGAQMAPPSAIAIARSAEDAVATFLTAYAPNSDTNTSTAKASVFDEDAFAETIFGGI
jgi:hypothetical protein